MKKYKEYLKFLHSIIFNKNPDDTVKDIRLLLKFIISLLLVIVSLIGPLFAIAFIPQGYVSNLFVITAMICWVILWAVFILGYFITYCKNNTK